MDNPIELSDGRLVCSSHRQVICYRCCVDYSFMEDVLHEENSNARRGGSGNRQQQPQPTARQVESIPIVESQPIKWDNDPRKGTGRVFPTKFVPPSNDVTPETLFSGRRNHIMITRYTLPNDRGKGLIYTDGACLDNGQANPKAGWAFWHGDGPSRNRLVASDRLENKGPFGDVGAQTSNRAELRAVIAALRFRHWPGEGFHTLVFATDSEYVVEGATNWTKKWVEEGWTRRAAPRTRQSTEVKNRDLWEALLGEVEKFKDSGMAIQFWRIPREWNTVADAAAKKAAASEENAPSEWQEMIGLNL